MRPVGDDIGYAIRDVTEMLKDEKGGHSQQHREGSAGKPKRECREGFQQGRTLDSQGGTEPGFESKIRRFTKGPAACRSLEQFDKREFGIHESSPISS